MTDSPLPPDPPPVDPVDLAASARLDGADPGPDAVEAEPSEVEARLDAFRAVSELVAADITPPPADVQDRQIAAALAAFDDDQADTSTREPDPVLELPLYRRPRTGPGRRWIATAAVAAVAAIVLAIPVVVALQSRSGSQKSAATAAASVAGSDGANESAQIDSSTGAGSTTSGAERSAGGFSTFDLQSLDGTALGPFTSADDLVARVRALAVSPPPLAQNPATTTTTAPSSDGAQAALSSCDGAVRVALPGLGALLLASSATLQGAPVQVLAYEDAPGAATVRLIAATVSGCEVVVDRPL